MKVIIGIDESIYSDAALRMVKEMHWPRDTRFIVLSAAPVDVPAYSMLGIGGAATLEGIQQEGMHERDLLTARAANELVRCGFDATSRVQIGDPRDVIVTLAENEKADLVIVGSHGRTGLPRLVMGSVASYVVSHAPCGVLVAKLPRAADGARSARPK